MIADKLDHEVETGRLTGAKPSAADQPAAD